MSLLQIGHWLEKISIEQLPGMAIASSALCLACFCLNWMLRRRSGSVQAFVWQITGSGTDARAIGFVESDRRETDPNTG